MENGSVEENIQISLETIDLDEDIEMTDELFRNEDVEEDCVLLVETLSVSTETLSSHFQQKPYLFTEK